MTQHKLYGFCGEAYELEKERIYEQEKDAIAKYFWDVHNKNGEFTPRDFGSIAVKFCIPLKVMDDFLNKATNGAFPAGTWDKIKAESGYKLLGLGAIWI